jgi:hypothetical protein
MTRTQNSWEIAKRSWAVLKSDRALAWFPVLSFLATLAVVGVAAGLVAAMGIDSGSSNALKPIGYVVIVCAYLALAFVQTYFLAGLVAGADECLRGGRATVRESLDVANSRLHRLLPWAIVTGTVTLILNQLERQGIVGRIIGSLLGLAWSLLTFLTIPILVIEDLGVGAALRRSKELFVKTWGENVIGQFGLGIVSFFALIPGIVLVSIGGATGSIVGLVVLGGAGAVCIAVALVAVAALSGIYRTALYRFAATGQVPAAFEGTDFQNAFKPREDGGGRGFGGGGFGGGFGGFTR